MNFWAVLWMVGICGLAVTVPFTILVHTTLGIWKLTRLWRTTKEEQ